MESRPKYRVLIGVAIAIAVIVLIEMTPAGRRINEMLHAAYGYVYWDLIKNGQLTVGEATLSLPKGQYGWIVHSPSNVTITSRTSPKQYSIIVDVGSQVAPPDQGSVEAQCRTKGCTKLESERMTVSNSVVEVTRFQYLADDKSTNVDAIYFVSSPRAVVRSFSDSEQYQQARSLAVAVLKQVIEARAR